TTSAFLYGAFGEVVFSAGADDHTHRFNGKEDDATTGLRYYGFRFYDPLTLRWTSADPLYRVIPDRGVTAPQRMNLYTFTLNNSVSNVDPAGLEPETVGHEEIKVYGKAPSDFNYVLWWFFSQPTHAQGNPQQEHHLGGLLHHVGHIAWEWLSEGYKLSTIPMQAYWWLYRHTTLMGAKAFINGLDKVSKLG